ncbi:type II toxin-antitoxin system VapC family toxin [Spirosoma sp. KUDC1026]|uniref:type II toxin-antitoxin system VapC family toxin n=1 Tax=Spirosoma sp. KUDC1026 TaxID=2745947 RepID=UPI00159B9E65|nr:type II toxin-antitoxin system VapC family toxin [Spirosoma sp. KUDC1026]QKZ12704.1 type II toxin-antitoxin system VapC family toxin [Spirosoma sp. KUDC1026]
MANEVILVDTSILIDYYRKTDKNNSVWIALVRQGYRFAISSITKYEIYAGATQSQLLFWDRVLQTLTVFPFDAPCVDTAVQINAGLKRKRKQIALADLFIAATAVTHSLPIATLNRKHFDRIDNLSIVEQ